MYGSATARLRLCTASTCSCPPAPSPSCWAATEPAARPCCAPLRVRCGGRRAGAVARCRRHPAPRVRAGPPRPAPGAGPARRVRGPHRRRQPRARGRAARRPGARAHGLPPNCGCCSPAGRAPSPAASSACSRSARLVLPPPAAAPSAGSSSWTSPRWASPPPRPHAPTPLLADLRTAGTAVVVAEQRVPPGPAARHAGPRTAPRRPRLQRRAGGTPPARGAAARP